MLEMFHRVQLAQVSSSGSTVGTLLGICVCTLSGIYIYTLLGIYVGKLSGIRYLIRYIRMYVFECKQARCH